ncbi:MAG: sporulation integral membrane protein YtvI [Ruminococcaceae bacterium]|nr:sporulation integral membrane protein YtvI [Oscillospiraceae bacterium]
MERRGYGDLAARLFCIICGILLLWFVFEYALGIILPFFFALCVGVPIYRASGVISKRIGLHRRLCALLLLVSVIFAVGAVIYLALNRLFREIEELVIWAREDSGGVSEMVGVVFGYVEDISSKIPFIKEIEEIGGVENFGESINNALGGVFNRFVDMLTTNLPLWAVNVIKNTPKVIITLLVSVISCFYFALDYGRVREAVLEIFSANTRGKAERYVALVSAALKKYAKAYILIMLLTFLEVFVGLLVLGNRYAFVVAFIVAIVDILPVFGAGTVLLPWALVSLAAGNRGMGVGLLILYGVVTIVRQIAEPRIVGSSLGIHPCITLFTMFAGLKLFGVAGMILGPAALLLIVEISGVGAKRLE